MKNLFALALLLFAGSVLGQQTRSFRKELIEATPITEAIKKARHYVDSLRIMQDIPGISVCVGTTEKILWAEGFGFADLEARRPVTIHSKFRIGSVSKSVTSFAIGKLVQDKKLDVDIPVHQYVPAFPAKKYSFTARQLATHTAGIRHYLDTDPLACPVRYANVLDGLAIFSADSLLFRPGSAYSYSTFGYSLLSAVIESASQTDYLSYMQQAVFNPIRMTDTGADYADRIVPDRVRFYEHNQSKLVNAAMVDNSYKWAGGGLLSTPTNLVKLGTTLLGGTFFQKETVALLLTPQLLSDGTSTNYGFGWRIGKDAKNRKIIHHGGSIDGGRTFLLLYPDNDLVIAITANMSGVNINLHEVETIANLFFNTKR